MRSFFNCKSFLAILLSAVMTYIPNLVLAEVAPKMMSTQDAVAQISRKQAENKILTQLNREDVRKQLKTFGVDADDAKKRLASLSNQEIQSLSAQMDKAQYGASVGGILVIVVLVLLIIYLAKRI